MEDMFNRNIATYLLGLFSYGLAILTTIQSGPLFPNMEYVELLVYLTVFLLIKNQAIQFSVNQGNFSLVVLISVFLQYGLVIELWLHLIGTLVVLLFSNRYTWTKILLYSSISILSSLLAAGTFYLLEGTLQPKVIGIPQLLPILGYVFISFVVHHASPILIHFFHKQEASYIQWESIRWSLASAILSIPLAVLMYIVDIQTGFTGIFLISIPLLATIYIFKMYYELHHASNQLKSLHDLSMSFSQELNLERTIASVTSRMQDMVPYDRSYLFLLEDGDGKELLLYSSDLRDSRTSIRKEELRVLVGEGMVGRAALERTSLIYRPEMHEVSLKDEPAWIKENQCLLIVPITSSKHLIGVWVLGRVEGESFTTRDLNIIQILASQAAIAIRNAKVFELTERRSLVDELTGLPNYRVFHQHLDQLIDEADQQKAPLSLLVVDIDYFKKVNDTFGHLVGNEVLQRIAKIIERNVRKGDIVARYGGEEFTLILPNTTCDKAIEIADRLRKEIHSTKFHLPSASIHQEEIYLTVTVSIGVACYPDHADNSISLVRHADRAMYIGSKQQGRNRVAVYGT